MKCKPNLIAIKRNYGCSVVGRVGFEPTITGARDQYYLDPPL